MAMTGISQTLIILLQLIDIAFTLMVDIVVLGALWLR
jgi:hypothetical protein